MLVTTSFADPRLALGARRGQRPRWRRWLRVRGSYGRTRTPTGRHIEEGLGVPASAQMTRCQDWIENPSRAPKASISWRCGASPQAAAALFLSADPQVTDGCLHREALYRWRHDMLSGKKSADAILASAALSLARLEPNTTNTMEAEPANRTERICLATVSQFLLR